jgi:outer membrane protein assembly factor BamB
MKQLGLYFFSVLLLVSCISIPMNRIPVESNFPLKQDKIFSTSDVIERIAVSESWLAVYTPGTVTAIDIETGKPLWQMNLMIQSDDPLSFLMKDSSLIATTTNQVWMIDKLGQKEKLNIESEDVKTKSIIRVASVYTDNMYINRFPDWRLEAYSISQNRKMWDMSVGRGSTDVFYDESRGIAYVATRYNSFYAIDNETGDVLWQNDRSTLRATYQSGVVYIVEKGDRSRELRISAFNVGSQATLWQNQIEFDPSVYFVKIINDLVIIGGDGGLLAMNKTDGSRAWQTSYNESFMSEPVEYDGIIYDKGTSHTVYAISPDNGSLIGQVTLERSKSIEPMYDLISGVYKIKDGIVFNTSHDVFLYKNR